MPETLATPGRLYDAIASAHAARLAVLAKWTGLGPDGVVEQLRRLDQNDQSPHKQVPIDARAADLRVLSHALVKCASQGLTVRNLNVANLTAGSGKAEMILYQADPTAESGQRFLLLQTVTVTPVALKVQTSCNRADYDPNLTVGWDELAEMTDRTDRYSQICATLLNLSPEERGWWLADWTSDYAEPTV